LDMSSAGCQHHQPVEAKGNSTGLRHSSQRIYEICVHRIALTMDTLLFVHRRLEPGALFSDVRQFAEAVGKLDPTEVKLETFGDFVAPRFWPRQGGQRQRVLI